ncbi:TrbI/VirB10 family protein [Sphingomonas sp. 3-13AW]|uniref:TrbI/VirB10 family protein n=1 Tax=Sphingomonas sp. 3-13AW TaxID=3050450 RepID=UPI003BB7C9A3
MAMDPRKQKKIMIPVVGGIGMLVLLGLMYFLFFGSDKPTAPRETLGASDSMAPVVAAEATEVAGTLSMSPATLTFNPDQPGDILVTLTANNGAVGIKDIQVPQADAPAIKISNLDCPAFPSRLAAGKSCNASVHWTGDRTVNTSVRVIAETVRPATPGNPTPGVQEFQETLGLTGVSTRALGATGPGAPVPGMVDAGQVGAIPPQSAPAATVAPQGPSVREQYQGAYLDARRGSGLQGAQPQGANQLQAAARSPYTSWDNIGVEGNYSSFPTDMARVITPDKPLPAVLVVPIDTRATVTAVAMVDRDVYGNNGRTIVIPRGTKVIGNVGGGNERVGIQWTELIRPDGTRFLFDAASGDAMGRGGIPGRVNERNLQRYGFTVLSGLVQAGATVGLGGQQVQTTGGGVGGATQTQDGRAVAAQQLGQSIQQINSDFFGRRRQLTVQVTVPAGTRITVWSANDLRLKPANEKDARQDPNSRGVPNGAAGGGFPARTGSLAGFRPSNTQQGPQQAQPQQPSPQNGGGDGGIRTGQIDANGNYIAPGAPSPGPRVLNGTSGGNSGSNGTNQAPWDR